MVELDGKYLELLESILRRLVPRCEVRAHGSRVQGRSHRYSDLDLVVIGPGPLDWATMFRLGEALSDSDLPMLVDVVDRHQLSDSFWRLVEKDSVVLQKPEE